MSVARLGGAEGTCSTALEVDFEGLVAAVAARLARDADIAPAALDRLVRLMERFVVFTRRRFELVRASEVRAEHILAFLGAPTSSGRAPSVATMHVRRAAVRLLFREILALGVVEADPTVGLALPARTYVPHRPLSNDEVERCRSFSRGSLAATREPCAWALAEATARCSELPFIRVGDLDLEEAAVHIAGGAKTTPRRVTLTNWGLLQVARRLSALKDKDPDAQLLGIRGSDRGSSRASAYDAIARTLRRAGLADKPGVRPNSLVAWRGRRALAAGSSIEQVARMLGMRSLDAVATFLGWDWQGDGA